MKKLIPLLLLVGVFTVGCLPGGPITVTTSGQPPVINSFDASPPSISAGGSSTLTWKVSGATTVSIDQGIGNVALTGSRAVMPSVTTVYTLTATNAAGVSATATTQVIVSGAPSPPTPAGLPVVNSFTASPPSITAGSSATLSWNVSNATSVTIDPGVGTFASSGTTIVLPAVTTTYILTATNVAGSTTAMTQVTVSGTPSPPAGLPVVNYFTANPPSITAGSSTTLSWSVSNATSVTIDPGVGSVGLVGTAPVSPATSTNYTLTATNAAGLYSLTIAVLVTGVPPPAEKPDLIIQDIWISGNTIYYKIKNQGSAQASASTSALVIDGVVKGYDTVAALAAGATSTESFTYSYTCSGASDTIVVHADKDNVVAESNEGNNGYSETFACPTEKTVTLYSVAAEDGHVNQDGGTNPYPNVGDGSTNKALQAFLSFNISGIPAGAVIKSASLDLTTGDVLGDPFAGLGWMRVYNHQYGILGPEDFTPGFPTGAIYTYSSKPVAPFASSGLVSALQARVNAGASRFQVRLQFQTYTDGDNQSDALRLGEEQPKLIIIYEE